MENKKILLIGGGGHCASVLDSLLATSSYDQIGIIDPKGPDADFIPGVPVVGTDNDLEHLYQDGWNHAFITLGSIGSTVLRKKIYTTLKHIGFTVPNIIDRTSVVSVNTTMGEGIFIGKRAVVNARSQIGNCAIINSGAIVEHDCTIGTFAHISPGCTLCGSVQIGNDSHIGAGSIIRQSITVGSNVLVGTGSNVVKSLPDSVIAYGNPCKVVKER